MHPCFPWFSVISANPALNPVVETVCGCLNCLRRFRGYRRFHEGHRVANHRFGEPQVLKCPIFEFIEIRRFWERLRESPKMEKFQVLRVVRRGCKRSFGSRAQKSPKSLWHHLKPVLHRCNPIFREGVNREKLTVKKLIDNEMFFFHRLCPLQTVKNRRKP